jgi:Domain of unknown function (DUF4288)
MAIFCARLLVVCLVDDGRPKKRNTCDYPFVLLEATDHESAFAKAIELGKKQETKYRNSKQQLVRWAFVKVEQITQLEEPLDGQEVGSLLDVLKTEEPLGYRKRFSPSKSRPVLS